MTHPLIKSALSALPAKTPAVTKNLLQALFEKMDDEDYTRFNGEKLAFVVQNQWAIASSRRIGRSKIQINSAGFPGDKSRKTIIDIISDDMAFIVDSVVAEINKNNFLIDFMIHPILYVQYDKNKKITDISSKKTDGYVRQSHIHLHIKDIPSEDALAALKEGLETALRDVYTSNQDWPAMRQRLHEAKTELSQSKLDMPLEEINQYCAFLDYLYENNFTLLGYREYEFSEKDGVVTSKTSKGSGLGLLADVVRPAYINDHEEGLPRNLQALRKSLAPVSVSKTNRLSTVHRRVPMDAIAVKTYNKNGTVKGEKLFLGLFTSVTYSRSVGDVPYLREKVQEVMNLSNFTPASHNYKSLRHILEKYPRDELFQITAKDLLKISISILRLQERQRIALFMRKDPFRRYISCLVYIPRDRFSTALRIKMSNILERELKGQCENFYTSLDDSLFARVMFLINVRQSDEQKISAAQIEKMLQEAGQTWPELLVQALSEHGFEEQQISVMAQKYGEAFPVGYTSRYRAKQSVFDIQKIEEALQHNKLKLDLYRSEKLKDDQVCLKVYNPGAPLTLSDVLPILENLGLRAIAELPFEIKPAGADSLWIHDFLLEIPAVKGCINIEDVKDNFEEGFIKIWAQEMENDALNRLILLANMTWQDVIVLRSYVRYTKQMRYSLGRLFVEKALTDNPKISRLIVDLFKELNDPQRQKNSKAAAILKSIETALESVESLEQDRTLRMISALVDATLRTNHFQRDSEGQPKSYISIKFDCSKVPELPAPRPYREIFVYSPRVEAIHLRGDKIARGGIRWSDRHEDFRTEVLGLMKAQMVKNSVIVPMGAKGGFVVKNPPPSRAAYQAEGIECYKIMIHGLLDITDNLAGAKIVPPKNVVRRDGDDPYLVVAADKGTASFSDIANSISQKYGFWLDDAFASGGSAGYDHKKMGITARGGWESVKLHFRQLGHDIQTQDFDVCGVGDMGGDVFGNGMLLSEHICLIGAFNHQHIFCDPNPHPAKSYKERKRLFEGVLGWDHYDTKLLSKGGRIYERSEKILTLTPEIKERFDLDKDKVSPSELMQAILKARTDLLWFGGIGTYIKSSAQTHMDVGDKANDALRIDAPMVRAKVLGEGANLAITQLGRVEFSNLGGRLNTDFVDNSGGVNSSDLEVNIKILLADIMRSKDHGMDLKARNKLLESMTADVGALVLRNNYQQAQAISIAELQAKEKLALQNDFIRDLEREKGLNRALEGLPDEEEIQKRLKEGWGLTRPELAILVSYAKINFTQELLSSDIPDSPEMQDWIINYFPKALQTKYVKEMRRHKLAREIIATSMANSLINRMGPTFIKANMNKTGASSAQIAKAYIIVRDAFDLRPLWDAIEALDNKVPAKAQLEAMLEIASLSERSVVWFLSRLGREADIGRDIAQYGKNISLIRKNLTKILTPSLERRIAERIRAGEQNGLPKDLAHQMAVLPVLSSVCDIIKIALEQKTDVLVTARAYFEIGEHFHLDDLRALAWNIAAETHWTAEAIEGLINHIFNAQALLTIRMLKSTKGQAVKGKTLPQTWVDQQAPQARKLEVFLEELLQQNVLDVPMLVIAEQKLRDVANL